MSQMTVKYQQTVLLHRVSCGLTVTPIPTMHFSSIFPLVSSKHQLALTKPVRSVRDLYRTPFMRHEHMLGKAMNMKEQRDVRQQLTRFKKNRLSCRILRKSPGRKHSTQPLSLPVKEKGFILHEVN